MVVKRALDRRGVVGHAVAPGAVWGFGHINKTRVSRVNDVLRAGQSLSQRQSRMLRARVPRLPCNPTADNGLLIGVAKAHFGQTRVLAALVVRLDLKLEVTGAH